MFRIKDVFRRYVDEHDSQIREWKLTLHLIRQDPTAIFALIIITGVVFTAIFAPWIAPYPMQGRGEPNLSEKLQGISWTHPFGTDYFGRDILSRIVLGTRPSLFIGVVVVTIAVLIGTPLGAVAGYYGGKLDEVVMRITDMFLAFPPLLLAIVIVSLIGSGLLNAMFAITLTWWPWYTRLVRGQAISLREREFVTASRSVGVKNSSIILFDIIPNTLPSVVIQATMDLGSAILVMASLGFLGLGQLPPAPDWGQMVFKARTYIFVRPEYAFFPGLVIFLSVLAFNLLGDSLRVIMDPRLRRVSVV